MSDQLIFTRAEGGPSSLDEGKRYCEFVASTTTIDSYGSVVRQNWRLERFNKNPIALRNHIRNSPIGKCKVWVEDEKLICGITFAKGTEDADETWTLVQQEVLRAVSVGFRPGGYDFKEIGDEFVIVYDSPELYEISVVSIPANEDCLARAHAESSQAERQILRAALAQRKEADMAAQKEPGTPAGEPPVTRSTSESVGKEAHDIIVKQLHETIAERDIAIAKLTADNEVLKKDAALAREGAIDAHVRTYVGKKLTAKNVDKFVKIAKASKEAPVEDVKKEFDELMKDLPDLGFGIGQGDVASPETKSARPAGEDAKLEWINNRTAELQKQDQGLSRHAAMAKAMLEAESKGL